MSRYPVLTDLAELIRRLSLQERELGRKLAELEERVQRFDSVDRPFYDNWVRLELGPRIAVWEEILDQIRQKRILAWRIEQLVEKKGLHPREALYVATTSTTEGVNEGSPAGADEPRRPFGEDEIEARRRAKLDAKRAARKDAKKEAKRGIEEEPLKPGEPPSPLSLARRRGISLYRKLAFRLHPDSAQADLPEARARSLWLEVQVAYEASDWDRLASIDAWMSLEDDEGVQERAPSRERGLADRYERIRTLSRSAGKLERKLVQLRLQPAWGFSAARSPELKKLRKNAANRLEEQVEEAARALEALEEYLESLGPPRPPKVNRSRR